MWSCGYALGTSIVRAPRKPEPVVRRKSIDWFPVAEGFAPSIGFQNLEIAARYCAGIVLGGIANQGSNYYIADYRNLLPRTGKTRRK